MWEEGVRIYGTLGVPNNFPWKSITRNSNVIDFAINPMSLNSKYKSKWSYQINSKCCPNFKLDEGRTWYTHIQSLRIFKAILKSNITCKNNPLNRARLQLILVWDRETCLWLIIWGNLRSSMLFLYWGFTCSKT